MRRLVIFLPKLSIIVLLEMVLLCSDVKLCLDVNKGLRIFRRYK